MPLMNQGENHCYSFGHALYLVAGLLDALRPHIFDLYNSDQLWDDVMESELPTFRVDLYITAQKFAKIKKLGFLLSLLDNLGLPIHSTRTDTNELLERQPLIVELNSGPPMLPADVVLRFRKNCSIFLHWKPIFQMTFL
eukprot:Gb_26844 [translate_table: standard]